MTTSIASSSPDILGGAVCFVGTRVPVSLLFDNLVDGLTLEQILDAYPIPRDVAVRALQFGQRALIESVNANLPDSVEPVHVGKMEVGQAGIGQCQSEVNVANPPLFNLVGAPEEPVVLEYRHSQLIAMLNGERFNGDRGLFRKKLGVPRSTVDHLLSGKYKICDRSAFNLARWLDVDADYFELTSAVGPNRRFKAGDGKVFLKEADCVSHDALLKEIDELIGRLSVAPKSLESEFSNGCGYIQHDETIFTVVRESLVRIGERFMPEKWFEGYRTDSIQGCPWAMMVHKKVSRRMVSAWERMERTDKQFREWGSAYYVSHPEDIIDETRLNAVVTI